MNKKLAIISLLILVLPSVLVSSSLSEEEIPWWNSDWCFRQEIRIPFNTSEEYAKFQPVDFRIDFDNPCWAKDENEHSVRVVFQHGDISKELESQIYDLDYTKQDYINSCNLVFLIPEEVDGSEKYFVYYSDTPKASPGYKNHVDVDESYYSYEPVPGLFFESSYYKIIEDGFIIYAVTQEGEAFNEKISQQVTKLKEGSEYVMPNMGDQLVSFDFFYWWLRNGKWSHISSSEHLVSKQVFVDGGLMVKFGIVSESDNGLLRSKVIYKYYYSPGEDKKIYTNVTHEVTDNSLPSGDEIDVAFAIFHCGGIKSSKIAELNFGEIPPFLHFYSDTGDVVSCEIDQYPEDERWKMIIGKQDDYDIGNNSWVSVDYGETGKAHSIIFDSNNILKSGTDERDGLELQMYEAHSINLPGLDGYFAYLYIMRNAFEPGEPADEKLPKNYVVSFNAEFFTTEKGGYKRVEEESYFYKKLIRNRPGDNNEVTNEGRNSEKYDLTVVPFLSQILSVKYLSSKMFFKYPYLSVELYQNNSLVGCSRASRVSLTKNQTVDWRNISIFRKAKFLGLIPGKYLVKIYLENLLLKEKEFIGCKLVDLQESTSIKVLCKPEGRVILSFYDQNDNSLENVECYLIKDDVVVSSGTSNSNGVCIIGAASDPSGKYLLRLVYKGFLIDEKEVVLRRIHNVFPLKKTFIFDVHDFELIFRDSKGKIPDFDVELTLTSNDMKFPVVLKPDVSDNGFFKFKSLYSSNYTLFLEYDDVEIFKKYNLNKDVSEYIDLYDFVLVVKDNWNLSSDVDLDVSLINKEYGKSFVLTSQHLSNGRYVFTNVFPGEYVVKIRYRNDVLEEDVEIPNGDSETVIVFPVVFNLTLTVYDSHGNLLNGAKVFLFRDGKHLDGLTPESGMVSFRIPPGRYRLVINCSDDTRVAERNIDVFDDKSFSIVTVKEPVLPLIVFLTGLIFVIGFGFICFKKKNVYLFLKSLVLFLVVLSVVSPWWMVNGVSDEGEKIVTSTNLYLIPSEMVTIISDSNLVSGEFDTLNDDFDFAVNLTSYLIVFVCFLMIFIVFLRWLDKEKYDLVFVVSELLIFIGVLFVFLYGMSKFSEIIVGGLFGSGIIDVLIPGEGVYQAMNSSWGLGLGFYLFVVSFFILVLTEVYEKSRKI